MDRYGKGARFERRVRDHFRKNRYYSERTAGSHGPVDVIAIKEMGNMSLVLGVQCATDGVFPPEKRQRVLDWKKQTAGFPLLAWLEKRKIKFEYVEVKK